MNGTSEPISGIQARKKILSGVNKVFNVVKMTLGPEGRNAILPRTFNRGPRITNDGVTISDNIRLKDEYEAIAADSFKEGSKRTNEMVGDGPQPLYSKILTPSGFISMKDIKVGDEICGSNKTTQKVLGVFPKGEKQIFKVFFVDGRIVECCEDHLWSVTTHNGVKKIVTTRSLLDSGLFLSKGNESKQFKYFAPVGVADFVKKEFKLDPYLVGLLLGDGSISGTGSIELSLGLSKEHILEKIKIPEGLKLSIKYNESKNYFRVKINGKTKDGETLKSLLKRIGLLGKKSSDKFIPKEYLYSDIKSRRELLQGLSDTDGHVNTRGLLVYSTISKNLYSDVLELLRGLGKVTHSYLMERKANSNSYSSTPIYRISELKGYKYGNKIIEIESTEKYTEMQCIKVSNSDHLYFTDDYVLTHNTTTTCVIAGVLINQVFDELSSQNIPSAQIAGVKTSKKGVRAIRKDMLDMKDLVIKEIKAIAKPIKTLVDLEKIAIVSIGKEDETIAKIVAKMVWDTARDATGNFINNHIDVTEGYKQEIETEVIKGMRFPSKVAHRAFVNKIERFEMVAEDVHVLITNYKMDNAYEVVDILNKVKVPKIAIFSPEFSPGVIKSLIETTKNGLFCYPIKCPALRTEQLEDLAIYTGGNVIDKDTGAKLSNIISSDLGFASRIIVKDTENREDAVLIGGKGEKLKRSDGTSISDRCEKLKGQIKEARNDLTRIQLEKRIANLSSAIGVIRVGATTSNEGLYIKLKIEDGVYACKAALEEGYVEGGGLCLKKVGEKLPENILSKALQAPYEQIQKNAGGQLDIGKDIIDPAKVVRLEIEHGVSVASIIITTDILIPETREKSPGEGYEAIANAINKYAFYFAKQQGLIRASEDEAEEDRNKEFERVMSTEK